jgi:catechol 2,3-dioxygenase-like lactoylglutathione lyase family enzyme
MNETRCELFVNVDVDDLERAVEFYTRCGLGLRAARRLFGGGAVELGGASIRIFLLRKSDESAPAPQVASARSYARHWTPVHLDFAVTDIEAAVRRACHAGAVLEGAITSHPFGRLATLADPFGHGLCLIELSERGYDAVEDPPQSSPSQ